MSGGHGHGHEAPKYEGVEAFIRQYLPENYHITYFVLGTYASIALLVNLRGSSAKAAALAAAPAPTAPDYHTPAPAATGIPDFGTKEWENFIQSNPKGFEIWLTGESK